MGKNGSLLSNHTPSWFHFSLHCAAGQLSSLTSKRIKGFSENAVPERQAGTKGIGCSSCFVLSQSRGEFAALCSERSSPVNAIFAESFCLFLFVKQINSA